MADTTDKVNQVKLKKNGQTVYPQTVTDAVAYVSDDGNTVKKLTTAVDEKLDTAEAEITYVKAEEVTSWTETDESSETQRTYTEALNELQQKVATNTTNISANSKAITDEVSRAKGAEGALDDLTTTEKGSLVGAVNEVKAASDETKQTVEGYFTEKKLFWDVIEKQNIVLRTKEKHINETTLKWEPLSDYTLRSVMVIKLDGAKKVDRGKWGLSVQSSFFLCKSFDANGDPVDIVNETNTSDPVDCDGYNYAIINDRTTPTDRSTSGETIYAAYYGWPLHFFLAKEMTQAEYDAQAPRDNADVQFFITRWMVEDTNIYPNNIVNIEGDTFVTKSKPVLNLVGTRVRNLALYCNYPNDSGKTEMAVAENPRLETLYIEKLIKWPKFWDNYSLKEFSTNDTAAVTNMDSVFRGCASLQTLDVSNWNTAAVTNMNSVFSGCTSLQTLDVSNWNTAAVTNMNSVFSGCTSLQTLDVSNWNTAAVTNMNYMFYYCTMVTTLKFGTWDMGKVTQSTLMFSKCKSLTTITGTMQNIKVSISLSNSPLTRESALVVINGLADLTGGTAQTLTLSSTTKALLTEEDKNLITSKNWSLA